LGGKEVVPLFQLAGNKNRSLVGGELGKVQPADEIESSVAQIINSNGLIQVVFIIDIHFEQIPRFDL